MGWFYENKMSFSWQSPVPLDPLVAVQLPPPLLPKSLQREANIAILRVGMIPITLKTDARLKIEKFNVNIITELL